MNAIHISLDLETWGKTPGCDIRSIGAVMFDPLDGTIAGFDGLHNGKFYLATDNPPISELYSQCPTCGYDAFYCRDFKYDALARDPETVQWWSEQTPEAQAAFINPVDLRDACDMFTDWLIDLMRDDRHSIAKADFMDGTLDMSPIRIWANDPHFDVSILDAVYRAVGLPVPWHYRAPRSMRTIVEAAGMTRDDMAQFNHGTAHNALDDAISQAMIVCEAYKRLGLQK